MKNIVRWLPLALAGVTAGCVLGTNAGDRLPKPATVSLQVLYQESQGPVPEADVTITRFFIGSTLFSMGSNIPIFVGRTDANGRFSYTTELNGNYNFEVSKPGASVEYRRVENIAGNSSFLIRLIEK